MIVTDLYTAAWCAAAADGEVEEREMLRTTKAVRGEIKTKTGTNRERERKVKQVRVSL